jgi:hypothetical protein
MSPKVIAAFTVLAVVVFALVAGGVYGVSYLVDRYTLPVGELHTGEFSVPAAGIEQAKVGIKFGLGELRLAAAKPAELHDEELVHLSLVSNLDGASATLNHTVTDRTATVVVEQFMPAGIPEPRHAAEFRSEWDMRLAGATPMDLELVLGLGENTLDLRGLNLTKLDVVNGAGTTTVDLRHAYRTGFDAELVGGTGDMTVFLPDQVGIRAETVSALGDVVVQGLTRDWAEAGGAEHVYVNAAYGVAPVTLNLEVVAGMGDVNLVVGGVAVEEDAEPRE